MNRTKRGYMLINEKKRFIYDGLNMIGRNRQATVIIPDASVSHYQSAIVVINEEHYISDINSSNGTFLGHIKLSPLQLYKINIGDFVKFGLVTATYFKLTDDVDVTIKADDECSVIEENIFEANTQVCDLGTENVMHFNSLSNIKNARALGNHVKVILADSVTTSINDLPTQVLTDGNDTESTTRHDSITISINDLPTQLLCHTNNDNTCAVIEEKYVEDEKGNTSTSYCSINDLPTQIISNMRDDEHVSEAENATLNQTSDNIIDETVMADEEQHVKKNQSPLDDDNSNESTDFLTMQPAATQAYSSESQSELRDNVQLLQRRVRNLISSDEESEDGKATVAVTGHSSTDEETDIEICSRKEGSTESKKKQKQKRCNKAIIESDSDTDIESRQPTNVLLDGKTLSHDSSSDTDVEKNSGGVTEKNKKEESVRETDQLNDSDMIPATQDLRPLPVMIPSHTRNKTACAVVGYASKYAHDMNFEASLADSFQLMLTNSPSSEELNDAATTVPKPTESTHGKNGSQLSPLSARSNSGEEKIVSSKTLDLGNEVGTKESHELHSQLEVSFESEALQLEGVNYSGRPANPLANIFENDLTEEPSASCTENNSAAHSAYDAVEKNLSKLFDSPQQRVEGDVFAKAAQIVESQIFLKPKRPDESTKAITDDSIFLQPTQMLEADSTEEKGDNVPTEKTWSEQGPSFKRNVVDAVDDALFLQPTQILDAQRQNEQEKTKMNQIVSKIDLNESVDVPLLKNDDAIFLQPTQILDGEHQREQKGLKKNTVFKKNSLGESVEAPLTTNNVLSSKRNLVEDDDDAIFLQPTQILGDEQQKKMKKNKVYNTNNLEESVDAPLTKNNVASSKRNVNDDDDDDDALYLQPTQILDSKQHEEQKETKKRRVCNKNNPEESVEASLTKNNVPFSKLHVKDDGDALFLQPTQIIQENMSSHEEASEQKESTKSDVFYQNEVVSSAIQPLGLNVEDKDAIFLLPTQVLDVNAAANENMQKETKKDDISVKNKVEENYTDKIVNIQISSASRRNMDEEDGDAIFLEPTYVLDCAGRTDADHTKMQKSGGDIPDENTVVKNADTSSSDRIPEKRRIPQHQTLSEVEIDVGLPEKKSVKRNNGKKTTKNDSAVEAASAKEQSHVVEVGDEKSRTRRSRNSKQPHDLQSEQQGIPSNGDGGSTKAKTRSSKKSQSKTPLVEAAKKQWLQGEIDSDSLEKPDARTLRRSKRKQSTEEPSPVTDEDKDGSLYVIKEVSDSPGDDTDTITSARKTVDTVESMSKKKTGSRRVDRGVPDTSTDRTRKLPNRSGRNSEDEFEDKGESPPKKPRRESKTDTAVKNDRKSNRKSASTKSVLGTSQSDKVEEQKEEETALAGDRMELQVAVPETPARQRPIRSTNRIGERKSNRKQVATLSSSEESGSGAETSGRGNRTKRSIRAASATSEDDFLASKGAKREKILQTDLSNTPERNKRKLKPKVVFTMLDNPELETIIRSLGGFVVDSVEASTVLLTGSVKRSQKLLSAVGHGRPICSPKWLHECKKANMFLDPWNYILEDREAENKWDFSLRESLRRSGERKLMKNYTFQIMVSAAQDVLKGAIEACGGRCVSRAPAKASATNFVVISSPENKNKYAKFLKQKPAPTIIAAEAIFDGVLRQELHFQDHLLS